MLLRLRREKSIMSNYSDVMVIIIFIKKSNILIVVTGSTLAKTEQHHALKHATTNVLRHTDHCHSYVD